jgi:1-acyl-sn-glycerol-3-phosphate acyltransferase
MARGDHVFVERLGYTHHGIDTGDKTVIHYAGEVGQKANATVCETPLEGFTKGSPLLIRPYAACDSPEVIVDRAKSRLGEASHNLAFDDCEHFATWCKTGRHQSEQVKDAAAVGGGAAAGRSGPGILSGLARVGARVAAWSNPLALWAGETSRRLEEPAFQRDPRFLETFVPLLTLFARYFDAEVRDLYRVPSDGPALLVGNHSGGGLTPDTSAVFAAWYEQRGLDRPLIGLGFDGAFAIPFLGGVMRRMGQVPASMTNAARALDEGSPVLVYPGGDYDLFRPWVDRNRIDFAGRKGFVRLALAKQVPVVPVVGHGGHDTVIVLLRSERMARWLGLERIRMGYLPIMWQLPWGLSFPTPLCLPLPAKITVQVCEPLDWRAYGPDAARDPAIVDRCYAEITDVMQTALTLLARENPWPVLRRLRSLLRAS